VANTADPLIHKSSNPNASRHVIESSEPSGWTFEELYSLLPTWEPPYRGLPRALPLNKLFKKKMIWEARKPIELRIHSQNGTFVYDTFSNFRDGNGKILISLSKNGNTSKAERCQENPIFF